MYEQGVSERFRHISFTFFFMVYLPFSETHVLSTSCFLFTSPTRPCPLSVEEIEQMNNLFQQKQRELVMAASKVEELNRQLELLKNGKVDNFHDNQSSVAELDRLYKELQVCRNNKIELQQQKHAKQYWPYGCVCPMLFVQLRNKLNQDQNSKLQQQRENLNKRNLEVATMDKRISELRDRLWKKKAALQQKENLPVSLNKQYKTPR